MDCLVLKEVNALFQERKNKIEEVIELRKQLDDLIKKERELYLDARNTSLKICNIQGHKLSPNKCDNMSLSRRCLVCGQTINPYNSTSKDSILEASSDFPDNIVYRKHIRR